MIDFVDNIWYGEKNIQNSNNKNLSKNSFVNVFEDEDSFIEFDEEEEEQQQQQNDDDLVRNGELIDDLHDNIGIGLVSI